MTLSWVKRGMLGSMLGGAYFRSPSCRRLQSRGRLGLRPYTALRTIAADVGPQNGNAYPPDAVSQGGPPHEKASDLSSCACTIGVGVGARCHEGDKGKTRRADME